MKEPNPENKNFIDRSGKTLEEWREIYLEYFRECHDDYLDEIPEEMVNGENPENHKYKVRGNWFVRVRESLRNCELVKLFPDDFNTEWHEFFKKYSERRISEKGEHRTTKEEIETVNKFLLKAQEILARSK